MVSPYCLVSRKAWQTGNILCRGDTPPGGHALDLEAMIVIKLRRRASQGELRRLPLPCAGSSMAVGLTAAQIMLGVPHVYHRAAINSAGQSERADFAGVTPTRASESVGSSAAISVPIIQSSARKGARHLLPALPSWHRSAPRDVLVGTIFDACRAVSAVKKRNAQRAKDKSRGIRQDEDFARVRFRSRKNHRQTFTVQANCVSPDGIYRTKLGNKLMTEDLPVPVNRNICRLMSMCSDNVRLSVQRFCPLV